MVAAPFRRLRYRPEGLAPDARGGARTFGRTGYAAPPRQSAKRHVSGSLTNRCLSGTYRGGFLWVPSNRRAYKFRSRDAYAAIFHLSEGFQVVNPGFVVSLTL